MPPYLSLNHCWIWMHCFYISECLLGGIVSQDMEVGSPSVMHMGKWVGWGCVRVIHHSPSMSPPPTGTQLMVSQSLRPDSWLLVPAQWGLCKGLQRYYILAFFFPLSVSSKKVSTFRITSYIGDFALLHDNWSGSGQTKMIFALYLPRMMWIII